MEQVVKDESSKLDNQEGVDCSQYCLVEIDVKDESDQTLFGPHKCLTCSNIFTNPGHLKTRQRIYIKLVYECENCEQQEKVHHQKTNKRSYTCETCTKTFSRSDQLLRHRRIHFGLKPFKCSVCEKTCSDQSNLKSHERTHRTETPYHCPTCSKQFKSTSHLNKHQHVHFGVKSFECRVCAKCFLRSDQLTRHERIHSGKKPFECGRCGREFGRTDQLMRHTRIHTHKPLKCSEYNCTQTYTDRCSLEMHEKIHISLQN